MKVIEVNLDIEKPTLYSCLHFLMFFCFCFLILIFCCYSVTFVCFFSLSLHPTPAEPTSLPHLYPPPWFWPCVLYSSSCNPLSSLSPPHSPLPIVRLFLTSMFLVIFCFLFSSVDYVPVKGEIIWYLSLKPVHPNVRSSTIFNSQVLEAT